MQTYLFVYGTLLQGLDSGPGKLLANGAQLLGVGRINGLLYDLGHYPGLVYDATTTQEVTGHIYRLFQPETLLPLLDAYEGFDERAAATSLYIRQSCPVQGPEATTLLCQVYIYQGNLSGHSVIEDGDYLAFLRQNAAHQAFIRSTRQHPS